MSSVNNKEHNKRVIANILKKNKNILKERERQRLILTEEVLKDSLNVLDKNPQPTQADSEAKIKEVVDFHRSRAI